MAGGAAQDSSGTWRISGHTFRITGARTLCNWGLDPITIQLVGRWGSSAVLSYLSEAPLEGFHHRIGQQVTENALPRGALIPMEGPRSDWDDRADVEGLRRQHNELIVQMEGLRKVIESLQRQSEDTAHKFEGVELCLADSKTDEIWTVHNLLSNVHHRSVINLSTPPATWRTLCGWQFSGKPHAHTNRSSVNDTAGLRTCPRCYPCASPNAEPTSSSSSSSSED